MEGESGWSFSRDVTAEKKENSVDATVRKLVSIKDRLNRLY